MRVAETSITKTAAPVIKTTRRSFLSVMNFLKRSIRLSLYFNFSAVVKLTTPQQAAEKLVTRALALSLTAVRDNAKHIIIRSLSKMLCYSACARETLSRDQFLPCYHHSQVSRCD